ncbi:STAS domain-containing protein [Ramlibacter sp.]|uniref:STAS domain-containing protein n=1 Tax=Ramlibacter sp. TaxID=1917967 RepID=UPI003D0B8A9E
MSKESNAVSALLAEEESQLVPAWIQQVAGNAGEGQRRAMHTEAGELLAAVRAALKGGAAPETFATNAAWSPLREALAALSRSRAALGQSAGDTSAFVLGFKRPLFDALQRRHSTDPALIVSALWTISVLVDEMAQWTVSTYQQTREELIKRQQDELLELSTPVIKLWEGVLAVPMIGTLDSARTQLVMETLLQRIVDTGSQLAIIDITGVPTVDTLVAQHLLKTVSAIRLMGADCIISGIRPQIAQTIVHLGIDLQGIASKASLADALALALQRSGYAFTRTGAAG